MSVGEDMELVLPALARGERNAASRCMERYGPLVWAIARRLSPTPHDAEDAVQDILIDLWKSAHRFDARAGSERVFVSTVARRRLIDRMRRRRARRDHETLGEEALSDLPSSDAPDRSAEVGIAHAALDRLPAQQQHVIGLSVVSGFSHSEIARHTGLPLGTVKTMVRRGLANVRNALEGKGQHRPAACTS